MTDARILVIEDEEVILEAIEAILECTIVKAMSVAEALTVDDLDGFDVVLVDKNLPDGSGLEIVRALKHKEPDLEFLIMTGFPSIKSAIEAIEVGAFDYLPKPFDSNDLALKVRNALTKTRLSRTERTLSEELRESEMRYRAIFSASSDAIIMMDAETQQICAANRAAQRLYGYDEPAIMTLRGPDLVAEEGKKMEYPVSGKTTIVRTDKRRDGASVQVEASRGTASYAGKEVVVEVTRDISERLRAEQQREQIEQRLRKSEKMETLGQLAAGIAHDYNNLLVVFMGAVSELGDWVNRVEGMTQQDAEFSLRELSLATQSAADLTRQLLGFSRRQVVYPEELDVATIMEGVVRLLKRTLEKRVEIETMIADDLPAVWMDRGHFEQIVTNLAINARDAMPESGTLYIKVDKEASTGTTELVLTVRDTGCGIAPEHMERIFEPFFTTKGPEEGTGLGLANVQNIVKSNGGIIHVSSTPNEGTTFEIRFPAGENRPDASLVAPPTPLPVRGRGERILLIEDHPGVRSSIERLLVRAGYSITCAATGEDGLATIVSSPPFDLLLVDLVLPEMQGDQVAEQVMAQSGLRSLCMSAFDVAAQRVDKAKLENLPFIAKPFSGDRLLTRLREVLEEPAAPKT